MSSNIASNAKAAVLSRAKSISGAAPVLACGAAAAAAAVFAQCSDGQPAHAEKKSIGGRHHLEMYLMDRIAKKPYLNYHSAPSADHAKRYRGRQNEEKSTDQVEIPQGSRPRGVPSRLRVVAIDVPQFKREAFESGGVCRLPSELFDTDLPKFVDGVAPPKPMDRVSHKTRSSRKPIVQKSLAKQLYYCYDPRHTKGESTEPQDSEQDQQQQPKIGVEILEASVMDLNPNNIRRMYTSTTMNRRKAYRFDPGKYSNAAEDDESGVADADEAEVEEASLERDHAKESEQQSVELDKDDPEESEIDSPDYERMAPWNQYAWLEEMHLRISGIIPFGAPVQRAHFLSQWLYGRIYKQSVPTSPSRGGWVGWLWWPVLWSGSHAIGSQRYRTWDGADGEGENALYGANASNSGSARRTFLPRVFSSKAVLNRASNKPHAVICDGAAMQRVPGSLRYLSKICRDSGIPLYIVNDPRSWGSQTHPTISDAIVDMRKAISDNVIRGALDLREGSAFERGRLVGQLEKELAWQASDAARKTREAILDARRTLMKDKVQD